MAAVVSVIYLILYEDALYARGVTFSTWDWIWSCLALLVVLEVVRRTTGWFIPCMIVFALTYVFLWGPYVDGIFGFAGLSLETVMFRSFFSTEGMFGPIARISWSFVFMFILFGAFLLKSGAGDFMIELSRCAAGRFVGGPGFVAVIGSGLMGSVSGSSVANTVSTGVITIPMMQKAGFSPRFAAGIEAASSTGGQLMPPVMGAGAFIMASYTQIPYADIIVYAALPALLYFLSVGFYVRVEAKRHNVQQPSGEVEKLSSILRRGWHHLLPLGLLVVLLIQGFTPTYAASIAILAVIISSWFSSDRMGLREVIEALEMGTRNMAQTALLLVAIGLVVNVVSMTGIGNTFSLMVTDWAGGSLWITLVLVAIASLVIGMGLPVTAAYIVLATLSAPAIYFLIAELRIAEMIMAGNLPQAAFDILNLMDTGSVEVLKNTPSMTQIDQVLTQMPLALKDQFLSSSITASELAMMLLSAHMIILWLSQDSNVTPPVCLTAFAAAAIAKTPPMKTGFMAWKIAKGLYIIPLLFAYTNIIGGPWIEVLMIFVFSMFGLYAFVGLIEGYLEAPLSLWARALCGIAALLLLLPHQSIPLNMLGLIIFIGLFVLSRMNNKESTQ